MKCLLSRRTILLATYPAVAAPANEFLTGPIRKWRTIIRRNELHRAFEYIEKANFREMKPGRHEVDGDRLYVMIAEASTRNFDGQQFEAHRRYADIHVLLSGAEVIGAARASDLKVAAPYDSEKEAEMYQQPGKFVRVRLSPGDFALFLPGQAHLPGCHEESAVAIRKAVVKVLMPR